MKFIKIFLFGIFIVIVLGLGVLTWGYFWIAKDLPKIRKITDYTPCLTTTVFSRNGTVLGYFYKQNRFLFSLKDVPSYVPRAFLAAEDSEFYHHKGIDFWGINSPIIQFNPVGDVSDSIELLKKTFLEE